MKHPTSLRHTKRPMTRRTQAGSSLIEVLVAVLIVSIGLLGAAGMHVRAIDYTIDTERRQMAAGVATELLETLRGDPATVFDGRGEPKSDLGGYAKPAGDALDAISADQCHPLPTVPATRLACWGVRARQLMPELPDTLITQRFAVELDAASRVVSVTVAWPVKPGECLSATGQSTDDFCTYTLQSRL